MEGDNLSSTFKDRTRADLILHLVWFENVRALLLEKFLVFIYNINYTLNYIKPH